MSILTQSGRAAIALSIEEQPIHLAWGVGDSTWEGSHKVEKTFINGELILDHSPVKDVKIFQGLTIYKPSIDYTVDSNTGVIKCVGSSSIIANNTITVEYTQSTPPDFDAIAK